MWIQLNICARCSPTSTTSRRRSATSTVSISKRLQRCVVSSLPVIGCLLTSIRCFLRQLEGLIESKIYREDELEREIETLKRDLKRATAATSTQNGASSQGAAPALGTFAAKTAGLQGALWKIPSGAAQTTDAPSVPTL